jgi:hypothetical protein
MTINPAVPDRAAPDGTRLRLGLGLNNQGVVP